MCSQAWNNAIIINKKADISDIANYFYQPREQAGFQSVSVQTITYCC